MSVLGHKESRMVMLRSQPVVTGIAFRGGVGLLLAGCVATAGLALERWHTARYGLALANLTPWIPSLLAFLLGVALIGASVGGWWYRHRRRMRVGATTRSRLDVALLIVGALLLLFNAPAALDLTLTEPTSATGRVDTVGFSISPFDLVEQYNLTVNGRPYTVTHDAYASDGGQCVTVVYGPRSQIAFAVTLVSASDLSAQRQFCGEPTSAMNHSASIASSEMRPH